MWTVCFPYKQYPGSASRRFLLLCSTVGVWSPSARYECRKHLCDFLGLQCGMLLSSSACLNLERCGQMVGSTRESSSCQVFSFFSLFPPCSSPSSSASSFSVSFRLCFGCCACRCVLRSLPAGGRMRVPRATPSPCCRLVPSCSLATPFFFFGFCFFCFVEWA